MRDSDFGSVSSINCSNACLCDVAQINPSLDAIDLFPHSIVSFVPMAAMSEIGGTIIVEENRELSSILKGFTPFRSGDILFAKITPCFENGKIGQAILTNPIGFGSTEFHVIRPVTNKLDGRYLHHYLRLPKLRAQGEQRMTGSAGQRRVPKDFLEQLRIPLPPLLEQKRIAAILDKADSLRRKRREAIAKLDTLLQSVFLEMFGDPVTNPKGWRTSCLGQLASEKGQIVDGPFGSTLKPEAYVASGIRVIRNFNIFDDEFDESHYKFVTEAKYSEIARSEVRTGDILISTKGTVGNVCLMPDLPGRSVLSASGTVRVRVTNNLPIRTQFAVSQMVRPSFKLYIRSFQSGSIQKYLNLEGIRKIQLILPPVDLQDRYCNVRQRVFSTKFQYRQSEQQANRLFQAIQSNCFTTS